MPSSGGILRVLGRALLPVAILGAALLLFSRFGELREMLGYLRTVAWQGLVLALLCQAANYLAAARAYRDLLATQGHRLGLWHLFKVVIVTTSLSYAFPTWGASGNAFFLVTLRRNGIPSMRGAVVVLLSFLAHVFAVFLFVLGSLAWLVMDDRLTLRQTIVLSAAVTAGVAIFLGWLWRLSHPERFARAAGWFAKWTRRGIGKTLDRERIKLASDQLAQGRRVVVRHKLHLVDPVLYRAIFFLMDCATLWVILRAMGVPADFGVATVGFTLALAAGGISLVPGGLGVTEVSMAFVLHRLGVDFEAAVVATLLFRLLSFWLPMPVGLLLYRGVLREAGEPEALPRQEPRSLEPLPRGERPRNWALFLLAIHPAAALAAWSASEIASLLGLSSSHIRLALLAASAGLLVVGSALSLWALLRLRGGSGKAVAAGLLLGHLAGAAGAVYAAFEWIG